MFVWLLVFLGDDLTHLSFLIGGVEVHLHHHFLHPSVFADVIGGLTGHVHLDGAVGNHAFNHFAHLLGIGLFCHGFRHYAFHHLDHIGLHGFHVDIGLGVLHDGLAAVEDGIGSLCLEELCLYTIFLHAIGDGFSIE